MTLSSPLFVLTQSIVSVPWLNSVMYDYKSPLETMYQPRPKPASGKATAIKVAAAFGVVALVGIAGVTVVSRCGHTLHHHEPVNVGPAEPVQLREQLPVILRRENSDESIPGLQPYDYSVPVASTGSVASGGAAARATGDDVAEETDFPIGVSVPILTQTSLTTIYTIRTPEANTTLTTTVTSTSTILVHPGETHSCTSTEPEETETVTLTVTVLPEQSQPPTYGTVPDDVTVTGSPATVTDVQTDVSYTSGAPDVTVSGSPATVTDVQTDTRYTSGAPDATVSGEPATVTSVITSTAGEPMTTLTFTSYNTVRITTTVTRSIGFDSSVLGLPHTMTSPSSSVVTHTKTVTVTGGAPVTSTTTVELPEPYGGEYPTPYGTALPINATSSPTYVPPVVSAGADGCGFSVAYLLLAALASVCLF
ncbi:hypothetical protein PWT90_07376 [Aphanocladium album]|nr:hypothetical protein PWT90_07376 [Aphanocladium album]